MCLYYFYLSLKDRYLTDADWLETLSLSLCLSIYDVDKLKSPISGCLCVIWENKLKERATTMLLNWSTAQMLPAATTSRSLISLKSFASHVTRYFQDEDDILWAGRTWL